MTVRTAYVRNSARKILELSKISEIPIPVKKIAEYLKLDILEYKKFPNEISALIVPEKNIVLVNSNHADVRKRFSIAHEIGHKVLDHFNDKPIFEGENEDNDVFLASQLNRKWSSDQESEADEFAAELLMPMKQLKSLLKGKKINLLAEKFFVSESAIWVRLSKLKLINYI